MCKEYIYIYIFIPKQSYLLTIQKYLCVYLQKELPNKKDCPHMCAYKLVTVKFKWWGLQNKVESFIQKVCHFVRMTSR